jgi:hypothetical protein
MELNWLLVETRTEQVESDNNILGIQKRRQLTEELLATEISCNTDWWLHLIIYIFQATVLN